MLRKTILAVAAAGLIGLATTATPASAQRWGGHWGHHGGWGWGGPALGLGLGLGLATAPLWAAPYGPYYGGPAYAYDPCWRRVWRHGRWQMRRVCW